jgi:hypothetical protein
VLIHGPAEAERRTLIIAGVAVVLCVAAAALLIVVSPFGGRPAGLISVTFDTPYLGQGVVEGTAVVMHGIPVGEVTSISSLPGGGVRLNTALRKTPVAGLTDAMHIDFRPVNYFGVSGVNLIAGTGGQPLRDGTEINTVPKGNFTLQALLSRLGAVSTGVLTPQLIQVIDRATRYTDALDPLIETALIAGNAVAQVQTVSTARLLNNTTGLSVVLPSTVDTLMDTGWSFLHDDTNAQHRTHADYTEEEWKNLFMPTLEEASGKLFASLGKLESSHVGDLLPVTDSVKALAAVVPPLIRPEGFAQMLAELRSRFEKMYAGTPEQRALQVRIVLDSLPGVAAPLGAMGGPQ